MLREIIASRARVAFHDDADLPLCPGNGCRCHIAAKTAVTAAELRQSAITLRPEPEEHSDSYDILEWRFA